ncbi:MAG: AsmA family protein [Fibrobacterota bacterium]|nr:AsmA family protein [Fibrobacterota bacterium]
MKVLKRIILAGIVLLLLLSLGAYFAIKLAFPPAKIKEMVNKHGSAALNRDVSVQDVSIRVFPNLKLSVTEINVANAKGFSADPCIKLRELALSINFLSLLRFSPVVNEIKLVDPEILYEVSKDGRNNLEGIGKTDTVEAIKDSAKALESPAAVALKSFVIENGRVRYRDLQTGRELILDKINQNVSLDLDQRLEDVKTRGKLEISEIKISDSASGFRKGNIKITVRHDIQLNLPAERIQVRSLELGFQDIRATVKGEATQFMTKSPVLDFTLSAPDIKLASVLKEVPASLSPDIPKLSAKGVAALEARIKGALDTGKIPDITAHFTIHDGGVSHKDLPAGIDNMNLELDLLGDSLRLGQFAFDMGGNPVSMNALVTSLRAPAPMLKDFNIDALLDLGKIVPLLQKLAMLDKELKADGIIQAKIKAAGLLDPNAPQNLKANGIVELKNVTAQGKPLPRPVKLSGQVKIDNEKIAENLIVNIGESDLAVNGTVTNYLAMVMPKVAKGQTKAKIAVSSTFLNLDELMPVDEVKKEGKEAPPMNAWPKLPNVDAEIDVKLARTQLMNLAMTDYTSKSTLSNGVLTTALKGSLYSGGFTSNLKADLRDTNDAKVALKLDVNKVEANDFISRLNDRLPGTNRLMKSLSRADSTIFGKFNLNLNVNTHGSPQVVADNITGKIGFALLDGKLMETGLVKGLSDALSKVSKSLAFKEFTFSNFSTILEAANGKLLVKDASIAESVVGAIIAAGSIGFDNTLALNLETHLPPKMSAAVASASGALTSEIGKLSGIPALANASLVPTDKAGRAILYFVVGGTLAKPSFSLDAKRMASEAGSGVKGALSDALNKKKAELKAAADAERAKLEAKGKAKVDEVKARLDEEKQKAEAAAEAQKKKAAEEAKKKGKNVLKGIGF